MSGWPSFDTSGTVSHADLVVLSTVVVNGPSVFELIAELELAAGNTRAAGDAATQGLEHMAFVTDSDRLNHERLAVLANLLIVEGEARATAGEAGAAQASWQRANALLDEKAAMSASPYVQGARVRLDRLRVAAND